jgi:hypothetical protein
MLMVVIVVVLVVMLSLPLVGGGAAGDDVCDIRHLWKNKMQGAEAVGVSCYR